VNNSKLQAALDELERLFDTVKEFKARNGRLPNSDSDAGRAIITMEAFADQLKKLKIGQLVYAAS
jgi:FtsZ-binding cell division protein ZapB